MIEIIILQLCSLHVCAISNLEKLRQKSEMPQRRSGMDSHPCCRYSVITPLEICGFHSQFFISRSQQMMESRRQIDKVQNT